MSKIDPNTNLPELPEGYRWRIKLHWPSDIRNPYASVKLKKGIWTVDSVEATLAKWANGDNLKSATAEVFFQYHEHEPLPREEYPQFFLKMAEQIMDRRKRQMETLARVADFKRDKKAWDGDYPPNKLYPLGNGPQTGVTDSTGTGE